MSDPEIYQPHFICQPCSILASYSRMKYQKQMLDKWMNENIGILTIASFFAKRRHRNFSPLSKCCSVLVLEEDWECNSWLHCGVIDELWTEYPNGWETHFDLNQSRLVVHATVPQNIIAEFSLSFSYTIRRSPICSTEVNRLNKWGSCNYVTSVTKILLFSFLRKI